MTSGSARRGERTGGDGPLELAGVTKRFGDYTAVDALDLTLVSGESLVLLGPSGCGKTTTLRLVAGFERPDDGLVTLDGRTLAGPHTFVAPEKRNMAVVFQSYALWPHMTVAENVGFGPRLHASRRSVEPRVRESLASVQLPALAHRYPHELSGGQQQRVALARALITRPRILLLDEPLSNLDTQLREEMRVEIRRLHRELEQTMIYVTHDQGEALSLADRIMVMRLGVVEQVGRPAELFRRPRNGFVARALGATNVVRGQLGSLRPDATGEVCVLGNVLEVPVPEGARVGPADISVRPGGITPVRSDGGGSVATISEVMFLGETVEYRLRVDTTGALLRASVNGPAEFDVGDHVALHIRASSACALEPGTDEPFEPADHLSTTEQESTP